MIFKVKKRGLARYDTIAWGCAYLLCSLWIFRNCLFVESTFVPTGYTRTSTVAVLNMWTLWWNCHQLRTGFDDYWNAPILFPAEGSFAFSEPQPITLLLAPVYWLTGSLPATYLCWMVLGLSLNGLAGYRLLQALGVRTAIAGCGGMLVLTLPAVFLQLDTIQIMQVWPSLWTLLHLVHMKREATIANGMKLGIGFSTCFFVSVHQGILFSMVLLPVFWGFVVPFRKRMFQSCLAAAVTSIVLLVPLAQSMNAVHREHDFKRSSRTVAALSADASAYLHTPSSEVERTSRENRSALSPGMAKYLLAGFYVALALTRRRTWRMGIILTGMAGAAFLLSLGAHLSVGGWKPWTMLTEHFVILSRIRSVFRFSFFFQIAVTLMAVLCLHQISLILRQHRTRFLSRCLPVICGLLLILETLPPDIPVVKLPDPASYGWADQLREVSQPGDGVWCLPMPTGPSVQEMERDALWMLAATRHHRPIVNGFTGFYPDQYHDILEGFNQSGLTLESCRRMQDLGVKWLVVDEDVVPRDDILRTLGHLQQIQSTADGSSVSLFRLVE